MIKNIIKAGIIILCALFLEETSFAEDEILLPVEELATESVLPVFEKSVSVKNRNIITAKRWDIDAFYSYAMTEPIANVSKVGLSAYYNLSEDSAIGVLFAKNFQGLSTYAEQLNKQYELDFSRAPQPQNTYLLDYNVKALYGKLSLSKNIVFNTILYGLASGGVIQFEHKSFPAVAGGVGQKFFITKSLSLRFDLRLFVNQAPIPFLKEYLKTSKAKPTPDQFDERITFTTTLDAGLSYLF